MISAGNDIISLKHTNNERTRQEKFYSKIISPSEAKLFSATPGRRLTFENFVWLAWSVKESGYKLSKRNKPGLLFAPTKIIIQQIKTVPAPIHFATAERENISCDNAVYFWCEAVLDNEVFYASALINNALIFTVANHSKDFSPVSCGMKAITGDAAVQQSCEVRKFVAAKLNKLLPGDDLTIEKSDSGYPFLAKRKNIPLSFAHHGNYVGYSFVYEPPLTHSNKKTHQQI